MSVKEAALWKTWGGGRKREGREKLWKKFKNLKNICPNVSRDDDKGALTLRNRMQKNVVFAVFLCKIQFCLVVDLFVDLPFFLPKSQIYLPFFWTKLHIYRCRFKPKEHVSFKWKPFFSPPSAAMFGDRTGTGLRQNRRGPSRSTELIFNQDFQGLFIYIIILALGCGDHGGVGEIIMTFRFMKNWGIEKNREMNKQKKKKKR